MIGAFGFAQPMQPRMALAQTIARAAPQPAAPAVPMLTAQNFMKPPTLGAAPPPAAAASTPATSIGLPGPAPATPDAPGAGPDAGDGLGDSDFLDELTGDGDMAEAMAGA